MGRQRTPGERGVALDGCDREPRRAGGDETVFCGVAPDVGEDPPLEGLIVRDALLYEARIGDRLPEARRCGESGQAPFSLLRVRHILRDQETGRGSGADPRRFRGPFAHVIHPHHAPARREQPGPTRPGVAGADDRDDILAHDTPSARPLIVHPRRYSS